MLVVEWRILLVSGLGSELDVDVRESDEALQLRCVIARTRARCARGRTTRGIIARVPVVVPVAVVVTLAAPLLLSCGGEGGGTDVRSVFLLVSERPKL